MVAAHYDGLLARLVILVAAGLASWHLVVDGPSTACPSLATTARVASPPLPVVMYHRVAIRPLPNDGGRVLPTPEFEDQLRYLHDEGYTTLFASDYLAIAAGRRPCPARPIMLTFDDGYDDNLFEAYPLLRRYGMKATFFVIVDSVGMPGHMSWDDLARISTDYVELGAHTMSHAALAGASARRLDSEVGLCRVAIAYHLAGRDVTSFAFPFGSHDDEAVAAVRAAGFTVAFTTERGLNDWHDEPLRLRRVAVARGTSLRAFAARIGGPPPRSPSDRAD